MLETETAPRSASSNSASLNECIGDLASTEIDDAANFRLAVDSLVE
jgi:hypothetical protein